MTKDRTFKLAERAFAIQRGKMWVSQQDFPNSAEWPDRYRGKSLLTFAGADHLELDVDDARALRDWLTSVLPDEPTRGGPYGAVTHSLDAPPCADPACPICGAK